MGYGQGRSETPASARMTLNGRKWNQLQNGLLVTLALASQATLAQPAFYESEPNNTPMEANPVSGAVTLYGTMVSGDQDGYLWTVADDDARKRWNFELHGIPGALTIVELARVEYTEDGEAVAGTERLMKMGTRDGVTPSVHRDQLFDPGEYLIGIAYAGGPKQENGGGLLRLQLGNLSFGDQGEPETGDDAPASEDTEAAATDPQSYRFIITEAGPLHPSPSPRPSESREVARTLRLDRDFSTFEPLETSWYSMSFDEKSAAQRWDIEIRAPIGRDLRARLVDANGEELLERQVDSHGRILFADLAPDRTTWYLELTTREPGFIHWIRNTAAGQRVHGAEAEPNDTKALANRVDFSQPVTGHIGGDDREDFFRFTVDEEKADQRLALRLESTPETRVRFCLLTETGASAQCKDTTTPAELPDLQLLPGDWGVSLSRTSEADYSVSLTPQGPIEGGTENEPNDSIEFASGVPSNFRIKGRFSGDDTDFYRFLIADEPQLWRFQVIGEAIHEVGYYDGSRSQKEVIRAIPGQRRVRLDNIYMLPGTHYLRVTGRDGGEYTLLARALGPPDRNGEMEPNDQHNMQRLAIGQTRTGLLAEEKDSDHYRFFLANRDHIRLTIQPPPDGMVDPDLYWYGSLLGDGQPRAQGEAMVLEGLFPPGDYSLRLTARQTSDAEYTLNLERLARFSCISDCEPNGMDQIHLAAPLPPDLVLEGTTGEWRDWDYYQLPVFEQPTEIVLRTEEPIRQVNLGTHYRAGERLQHDPELGGYRATVPGGESHRIMIDSNRHPYRLQLLFPNGELQPVTEPLAAELSLAFETGEVSAFRILGQQVSGDLTISNTGSELLEATLEAVTSDYRWRVELARPLVTVAPESTESVPVAVLVPADAWADRPVRISMRALGASGRQAETWSEIAVGRETVPVNPALYWSIPEALRGGFNAAWLPFGAQWTEETKLGYYDDVVRDGLAFDGARMEQGGDNDGWTEEEKPLLTLDLPGDDPVPVAGTAINHFGTPGVYVDIREATLLLSMDGVSFEEALRFEALPVETEQQFALEEPIPARFARLRIDSTFQERSSQRVFFSEWKVILRPGFDLSDGAGFDIANPAVGGHLVWDDPPEPYSPTGVLTDEANAQSAGMRRGPTKDYVIGFNQNRAAQITRIEWNYPEDLEERWRNFERVNLSFSLESPIGPWLAIGEINLSGAKTTGILDLPEPTWARFVRFTAHKHPDAQGSHEPGIIRIWERPTADDYLSVLTEWGDLGPRAFYELQAGIPPEAALEASSNHSRATAATLDAGTRARGQVSLEKKLEHWYRLAVPAGDNTLEIELTGDPTVRTVLAMEDHVGNAIPLRRIDQQITPGQHEFEAVVEPGSEVWFKVAEPPRNVVFTWDTSASVNAHIPLINNSLVAFSTGVVPGEEAVNLMPFSMSPLLEQWYGEPYVLQTVLNDYRRGGSSSSAERTLKGAATELAPRPGTKAIMVITDGETVHDGSMWNEMRSAQPRIFAVQVAGSEMWHQNVMRDWVSINGGHFSQLRYSGEMEIAFDRASTLMHRPAGYTLLVDSAFREAPGPGLLSVLQPEGTTATGGAAVELILDASGSMLQRLEGKRRIVVAKEVLTEAVQQHIPAGTPVALRVFGHKEVDSCRTDLEIPLGPLDPVAAASTIDGINAMNLARTPIADSLAAVENDLQGAGSGVIVLVTDGEETCEGDPGKVIEALRNKGLQVSLNIVGFAIDDVELAAQFESWAELGGGRYLAANDQGGLSQAIEQALKVPYTAYDQSNNEVASGTVDGAPVELASGLYRVVVKTSPPLTFEDVDVRGEDEVVLRLE